MRNTRSTVTQASYLFSCVRAFAHLFWLTSHTNIHIGARALRSSERACWRTTAYVRGSKCSYIIHCSPFVNCELSLADVVCACVCWKRGRARERRKVTVMRCLLIFYWLLFVLCSITCPQLNGNNKQTRDIYKHDDSLTLGYANLTFQ